MNALSNALEDYLAVRRALGYKLDEAGRQLAGFVAYMDAAGAGTVTTELAVTWATLPRNSTPVWWGRRLTMVRGFARHLHALDPNTEVPPPGALVYRCRRSEPFLYSDDDIAELMTAARALLSPQRAATYECFVGLLAVTGMRAGEAVRLDRDHIDWDDAVVTVWNSKFQKSRALPVHATTLTALDRYARVRDEHCPRPKSPAFLLSTTGTRLDPDGLNHVFRALIAAAGLEQPGRRRPRPHDLRHSFAVRTLLDWYRTDADVEANMALLSTYLGHSHPEHTFWYLSAVPELLDLASQRLERAEQVRS
jgi:integrase/recombinase XerD